MLGKLLELLLAAKAGALPGVLVLAGAVVTVTSGNGVATVTIEQASPTPTVTATASPTPTPTPTPTGATTATPTPTPAPSSSASPAASAQPASCAADAQARNGARQRVQDAYVTYHTALAQLRGGRSSRLNEALSKADEMVRAIAKKADEALRELGCHDADEIAIAASGDAAKMSEIADRAVPAMETVFNAAKALADAPSAAPSPKARESKHGPAPRRDEHHEGRD